MISKILLIIKIEEKLGKYRTVVPGMVLKDSSSSETAISSSSSKPKPFKNADRLSSLLIGNIV
ncbi:MAG: hypothetical protein PHS80_05405 [Methanothrix sp.]|nr:hypothetical protein [Methanothrix sp.]MDD4447928.1 hypothetical protein [Methanothrix sp.]